MFKCWYRSVVTDCSTTTFLEFWIIILFPQGWEFSLAMLRWIICVYDGIKVSEQHLIINYRIPSKPTYSDSLRCFTALLTWVAEIGTVSKTIAVME